jgi:hypothetical protein
VRSYDNKSHDIQVRTTEKCGPSKSRKGMSWQTNQINWFLSKAIQLASGEKASKRYTIVASHVLAMYYPRINK